MVPSPPPKSQLPAAEQTYHQQQQEPPVPPPAAAAPSQAWLVQAHALAHLTRLTAAFIAESTGLSQWHWEKQHFEQHLICTGNNSWTVQPEGSLGHYHTTDKPTRSGCWHRRLLCNPSAVQSATLLCSPSVPLGISHQNQSSSFAAAFLCVRQVRPFWLGDFTAKSQEIQAYLGCCAVA